MQADNLLLESLMLITIIYCISSHISLQIHHKELNDHRPRASSQCYMKKNIMLHRSVITKISIIDQTLCLFVHLVLSHAQKEICVTRYNIIIHLYTFLFSRFTNIGQGSSKKGIGDKKHTFTEKIIIVVSILLLIELIEATANRRDC